MNLKINSFILFFILLAKGVEQREKEPEKKKIVWTLLHGTILG